MIAREDNKEDDGDADPRGRIPMGGKPTLPKMGFPNIWAQNVCTSDILAWETITVKCDR